MYLSCLLFMIYLSFWCVSSRRTGISVCFVHCHFPNISSGFWYIIGANKYLFNGEKFDIVSGSMMYGDLKKEKQGERPGVLF